MLTSSQIYFAPRYQWTHSWRKLKIMRKAFLVLIAVVHCKSEKYFYDLDKNYTIYPIVENRNLEGPSLAMMHKDEDPMRFYRADVRKREPQFLGFDIQDDNIEVALTWFPEIQRINDYFFLQIDMEMAVPFLSVPTMKSLTKQKSFANLNVGKAINWWLKRLTDNWNVHLCLKTSRCNFSRRRCACRNHFGWCSKVLQRRQLLQQEETLVSNRQQEKKSEKQKWDKLNGYSNEVTSFCCFRGFKSGGPHLGHIQQYWRSAAGNRFRPSGMLAAVRLLAR